MSNPAESVSVLIEDFKYVAVQEDGLRPYNSSLAPFGWDSITSDGDIGTVTTTTYKPLTFGTFSTDDYGYCIARGKAISGNWQFGVKTGAGNDLSSAKSNSTFETMYFALSGGQTAGSFILTSTGTALIDYIILSNTAPVTLTPSNITTENVLTEGFDTAELNVSYPALDLDLFLDATDTDSRVTIYTLQSNSLDVTNYDYIDTSITGSTNALVLLRFFTTTDSWDVIPGAFGTVEYLNNVKFSLSGHSGLISVIYFALKSSDGNPSSISLKNINLFSNGKVHSVPMTGWIVSTDPALTNADYILTQHGYEVPDTNDHIKIWMSKENRDNNLDSFVHDNSGYGNTGYKYGGTWVTGRYGKGLSFSTISPDYVNCGNDISLNITNAITIAAWVKLNSYRSDGAQRIVDKTRQTAYALGIINDDPFFGASLGGVAQMFTCSTISPVPLDNWAFVAVTYNGTNVKFYVDGSSGLSTTPSPAGTIGTNTDNLTLSHSGYPFDGVLDEVRIYNRALNDTEIKDLYENTYTDDTGLVLYLPMEGYTNFKKIFTGKIDTIRKISRGKEHRWIELDASGYGKYLTDRKLRYNKTGNAGSIILDIVDEVINDGLITAHNIQETSEVITVKTDKNDSPLDDLLRSQVISVDEGSKLDWDFYIDRGSDLHAFQRGIDTIEVNLANDMFTFEYEKSIERLINKQEIKGAWGKGYGGDAEWTQSLTNWSPCSGGTLVLYNDVYKDPPGTVIVCGVKNSSGQPIWLERTISPMELRGGGYISFDYFYAARKETPPLSRSISLNVYLFSSDNDYIVYNAIVGGGREDRFDITGLFSPFNVTKWGFNWAMTSIPIDIGSYSEWTESGNPDVSAINKIRIEVDYPRAKVGEAPTGFMSMIMLDRMSVDTRYYGIWNDYASQSTYGVKEGLTYIRPNLISDEECTIACSLIVADYKNPLENVRNLEVSDNFGLILGTEYVFNALDINNTLGVRRIRQNLNNLELSTEVDLAEKYIPTPEVMLSTFQRMLEVHDHDLELVKKLFLGRGISPGLGRKGDWWDQDPVIGSFVWSLSNGRVISGIEEDFMFIDGDPYPLYTFSHGAIYIWAPVGNGNWTAIYSGPTEDDPELSLSHEATIILSSIWKVDTNVSGCIWDMGPVWNYYGFGWNMGDGGTLLAKSYNSASSISWLELDDAIVSDTWYKTTLVYYPNDKIICFLDDEYKGSITTALPTQDMPLFVADYHHTVENPNSALRIKSYMISEYK